MPCTGAIPCADPLITAEPTPAAFKGGDRRRVMPWEALCFIAKYGPVTTDPFGVRLWSRPEHGQSTDRAIRGLSNKVVRDEGIVCPPGNRGLRRSSDLHEWRNDLGTVSTGDSAKLHYE